MPAALMTTNRDATREVAVKLASGLPSKHVVLNAYTRAIADEEKILKLWPDAKGYKKEVTSSLGFSPAAEAWLTKQGARKAEIDRIRAVHRKTFQEELPDLRDYKPSELIVANLHEAWIPYGELLLHAGSLLQGADFAALKPQLVELGFDRGILSFFRPMQQRKYFL